MELTPRQIKAARMYAVPGTKTSEVAKELGVAERTVRSWRPKPAFQAEIRAEIDRRGRNFLPQAWKNLMDRTQHSDQALRLYFQLMGFLDSDGVQNNNTVNIGILAGMEEKDLDDLLKELEG